MAQQEVLFHVPGDREAVLEVLESRRINTVTIQGKIFILNTYIVVDKGGRSSDGLGFNAGFARENEGQPIMLMGKSLGVSIPYPDQVRIFNALKRAIMNSRKEYYEHTEEQMRSKRNQRDNFLQELQQVIDFERNLLAEDHRLEKQIRNTQVFLGELQRDFPRSSLNHALDRQVDVGVLGKHNRLLDEIIRYLQSEDIEALHILREAEHPVQGQQAGKRRKLQKKHLKKIAAMLNRFVREVKYFLRAGIRGLQITPHMRAELKHFYESILRTYSWYAELFTREAKK